MYVHMYVYIYICIYEYMHIYIFGILGLHSGIPMNQPLKKVDTAVLDTAMTSCL